MALKDYLAMIDNGLKEVFDKKPADPTKARRPLLRGIDRALAQRQADPARTSGSWWQMKNGVVAMTVKLGGDTFVINGVATNHMPANRFDEFLGQMRAAVEAGAFDAELANHGKGDATVVMPRPRTSTISPEAAKARGIKAAASRKANREKLAASGGKTARPLLGAQRHKLSLV